MAWNTSTWYNLKMATQITREEHRSYVEYTFDAVDEKGRKIGACAVQSVITWAEVGERAWGGSVPPGTYFAFYTYALRDGKKHGAMHKTKYFATEAERQKAVDRYFAGAHKRAEKKMRPPLPREINE